MEPTRIATSIMFKHMLEQNRALSGKAAKGRSPLEALLECAPEDFAAGRLALLTLHAADFHMKFAGIGVEAGLACLEACLEEAVALFPQAFPGGTLLVVQDTSPGDTVLLFRPGKHDQDALFSQYLGYREAVARGVREHLRALAGEPLELRVGFARLERQPGIPAATVLFAAVCKAKRIAQQPMDPAVFPTREQLRDLLTEGLGDMVFQPVADLTTGVVIGWEAFARCRTAIPIQDALRLVEMTGPAGRALDIEWGLWRKALAGVGRLSARQRLFLNVGPACLLAGRDDQVRRLSRLVEEHGLERGQIVLEFSERLSPAELAVLPEQLQAYRENGFGTAIDDVGAGQSNMMLLARLRPDYFKADIALTRDIERNPFKRVMVETLVLVAEKIGARVIAEGVETELALSSLVSMGVHAGQGFLLGAPAFPKPEGGRVMPPKAGYGQVAAGDWKCASPVGELIAPCLVADVAMPIGRVKDMLADKPVMCSVVVVEDDAPVGLVMNYNLDKALSSKFGVDLYHRKRISRLMDAKPLCVAHDTPIEKAARLAMNRLPDKIYDDIVVTRDGVLLGTVSVQRMLDTLAKVQVELAKGSNPLTGLPGNVAIEREFARRGRERLASCIMYVDLDNFKVYNDVYGFSQGDKVILLTATCLREAVGRRGAPGDFIGHVGGDDFVVIASPETAGPIAAEAIEAFAAAVPGLYTPEDRTRGHIRGKDREGRPRDFPLITLSIGILDCLFQTGVSFEELSHRVASVKKQAKATRGNSVVHDRCAPLGGAADAPPKPAPTS